ncbi:MAG: OmpA family protein [Bacteroidales bacterium]|nr:OmpA family protein [Bacteroidales bacterium]
MKSKSTLLYIGLALSMNIISTQVLANRQSDMRAKAENLFNGFQYSKAAEILQKITDTSTPELKDMERLAECYKKMNKYEDAEIWYARIVSDPKSSPENLVNYGEILKSNASYPEAKKVFQRYVTKTGDRKRVAVSIAGCDSARVWISKPINYKIKNEAGVNTILSEFSIFPSGDNQVYFTREPLTESNKKKYGWTGNSFLRVFTAERHSDNSLDMPKPANSEINNGSYHVGPVSTNKTGDMFFITRTHSGNKGSLSVVKGNTYQTQNMEIYMQARIFGKWLLPEPFAYNHVNKYSVGHAVLSKDEKVLYFVSDMAGGLGRTDIWYSVIQPDGKWGRIQNAGNKINTSGNELFPTIGSNGELYFSSDGHPGMGGLDIFCSKGSCNQWSKPVNMRYPINSPGDDFSFIIDDNTQSGYLSSNRVNGKGGDDIYSFSLIKPKAILAIAGIVYDKKTREILPEAIVTLYDSINTIVARQVSKPNGAFLFQLKMPGLYRLQGTKNSYYPDTTSINFEDNAVNSTLNVSLYLDPLLEKGKTFRLNPIFYNFDKYNIREDAAVVLNELVRTMHENPTLKIELASHTDSRGTDKYNMDLSQNRAQSVVNYLVSRGISRDRMVAKGYGESRLINRCADGIGCTEAEHQENRRTEFTVLSY